MFTLTGSLGLAAVAAAEAGPAPERVVLEGVPKIGYHVHMSPTPGSLFACLQYLKDPVPYDTLMGVTGAAFRRIWSRDDGGNVDLMYLAPEPHERAFRAIGREFRVVPPERKDAMIQALKESIATGRPLLAFGIIGPPECGIVAGYDRRGEVLLGYSYFQEGDRPGYYEKADWYEGASWAGNVGFILIGEKRARPPERETLLSTLAWAIDLARTPKRAHLPDHVSGLAAYEAWAAGVEVDADYPRDNAEVLGTRVMVHGDQTVMLCERANAAGYLRSMVEAAPEAAAELKAAAALYDEVVKLGPKVWPWGHDMGPATQQALADPKARREIAQATRQAGEIEALAVEHLEKALARMKAVAGAAGTQPAGK